MNPYICQKHGKVDHYFLKTTKRIYRRCRLCRTEYDNRRNIEKRAEIKKYHADWYQKDIEKFRRLSLEKNRKQKRQVIEAYGGKCQCCGVTDFEFLTIDHINGNGRKDRLARNKGAPFYRYLIKEGFPRDGYRLLCMNCNFSLGKYGYCPHRDNS